MGQTIADFIDKYGIGLYIPRVHITDIIEVLILTFLIYQIIIWRIRKHGCCSEESLYLRALFFSQLYSRCIRSCSSREIH